ncbi:MAG TPA: hypothetical protein HA218_05630 [Nanoarchaeota archaeon]|nr:hypothetical protein [Nanoarchaeota archaeon]
MHKSARQKTKMIQEYASYEGKDNSKESYGKPKYGSYSSVKGAQNPRQDVENSLDEILQKCREAVKELDERMAAAV